MKNSLTGFMLAIQFFTAIPVRKQFDMNARSVTWMYGWLPVLGLLMGSILAGAVHIGTTSVPLTSLFLAIILVVGMVVLTGGLHLNMSLIFVLNFFLHQLPFEIYYYLAYQ